MLTSIIIWIILLIPVLNEDIQEFKEERYKWFEENPLPPYITMMATINMMEVGYYTFVQFKEEDIQDAGVLYQIALEVSKQNEEAMREAEHTDDSDTVPDSQEQVDFFESLREEL